MGSLLMSEYISKRYQVGYFNTVQCGSRTSIKEAVGGITKLPEALKKRHFLRGYRGC